MTDLNYSNTIVRELQATDSILIGTIRMIEKN